MDYQRFLNFSNNELSDIINDYGMAKNTNLSTDNSMRILVKYMTERSYPNLEEMGKDQIDNLLYAFFAEARTEKGDFYKKTSFDALKYGINRYLQKVCYLLKYTFHLFCIF